jgi:hypothetical protein
MLICVDQIVKQQAIQFAAIGDSYAGGAGTRVD